MRRRGNDITVVEGGGDNIGRDQPADMGHVGEQVSVVLLGNLSCRDIEDERTEASKRFREFYGIFQNTFFILS